MKRRDFAGKGFEMRLLTTATIALFAATLAACGQTKAEAEADLAAKEAAANPSPAEAPPAEAASAEEASAAETPATEEAAAEMASEDSAVVSE
jgi:hypothetical protein